jgi:hypothetical protein
MFNMKALFLRALLALTIAVGAPAALAGPIYRVSLDTSSLAGITGYLDLGLNGELSNQATATVSNFSGAFVGAPELFGGAAGDVAGGAVLRNTSTFNFFDQLVDFGGVVSFDVTFTDVAADNGLLFSVALMSQNFDAYLGAAGNLFEISLVTGEPTVVDVLAAGVDVNAVPEPADWLLLATGLMLIGFTRRMQSRR